MSPRRVLQEFEYGGVPFEPEERVFLMFGSANRDEQWFEDPDRFDIARTTKGNLTFGAGPPFHPGAAASRSLVGDVALPMIFDRLDGLRLADAASRVDFGGRAFHGPLAVPVNWGWEPLGVSRTVRARPSHSRRPRRHRSSWRRRRTH
jgi:cytochrome P450